MNTNEEQKKKQDRKEDNKEEEKTENKKEDKRLPPPLYLPQTEIETLPIQHIFSPVKIETQIKVFITHERGLFRWIHKSGRMKWRAVKSDDPIKGDEIFTITWHDNGQFSLGSGSKWWHMECIFDDRLTLSDKQGMFTLLESNSKYYIAIRNDVVSFREPYRISHGEQVFLNRGNHCPILINKLI